MLKFDSFVKSLIVITTICGGACGVMVIVVGNGHGDMSSNEFKFHIALIPLGNV